MVSLADWEWAVSGGFVFIAAIVRGFAGFGFSALSVATLSFFMSPAVVVPIVLMMEIIASAWMLPGVWRHVDWPWLRVSAVGIFIGSPIGVAMLAFLPAEVTKIILYAALVFLSSAAMAQGRGWISPLAAPVAAVGLVAGVMNGLAGLAGMVIAIFLLATTRAAQNIRASMIILFFISDIYALIWGGGLGLLAVEQLWILLIFLAPLITGIIIGGRLFNKSDKGKYRAIVLSLIFFIALSGIVHQAVSS